MDVVFLSPYTLGAGPSSLSTDSLCRHKTCMAEIRQQTDQCNGVGIRHSMKKSEVGARGARDCVCHLVAKILRDLG